MFLLSPLFSSFRREFKGDKRKDKESPKCKLLPCVKWEVIQRVNVLVSLFLVCFQTAVHGGKALEQATNTSCGCFAPGDVQDQVG